jgi:ribosome-associated translation inhibitor RaiA
MQIPLQITYRNMEVSEAIDTYIRERAAKLDGSCTNMVGCRVVVEAPHKHQHKGGLFHVSIDITLPKESIIINREPELHQAHQDPHVAVRDAFDAAQKQLRAYVSRQKGEVKTHEAGPHGRISVLYPMEDYGRILSADGGDIYFHRNSVLNMEFDALEIGTEVRFVEQAGDEGPQASSVWVAGKPHSGE